MIRWHGLFLRWRGRLQGGAFPLILVAWFFLTCTFQTRAELPGTRLLTVFPPGGQAGGQVEVAVTGADMEDVTELHFSQGGIVAKQKMAADKPEAGKFVVSIAADVPVGVYEARLVGRFGISNPRAFVVGDMPEVLEKPGNNSVATAGEIALGTVINARAEANAEDYFRFTAKKGQRVLIECVSRAIDSRMEPSMIVSDAAGHELDRTRGGRLLDFVAPDDGQYIIAVHDFVYGGGPEHFYRLSLRAGPYIDYIFPPCGVAGSKGKYTLFGRNLPGGTAGKQRSADGKPLEELSVEIEMPAEASAARMPAGGGLGSAAAAALDAIEYRLHTPQGVSNAVLIGFATGRVVEETSPNDKPAEAQKVIAPCEYVGRFYPHGDRDWITFDAKKGDIYWIEVFSHRLGLPTAPFLLIQKVSKDGQASDVQELYETDANIGGAEFKTSTRDPAYRFEAKEDAAYRVMVRDLFNESQNNPALVYRLSIRKGMPDFRLAALPQSPPAPNADAKQLAINSAFLLKGGTTAIKVLAFRRDGFAEEIQVEAEGLPAGVMCSGVKIAAGSNAGTLVLTATDDAAAWVGPIKIAGKAKVGEAVVKREARGGSLVWPVTDPAAEVVRSRMTGDIALAVSRDEPTPLAIAAGEGKVWESPAGGKLRIPVKVARRGQFNAPLKLKAVGVAALNAMKELEIGSTTTEAALEIDLGQIKLAPGNYSFYLQTQTAGKYNRDYVGLRAAEEQRKEAEKTANELGILAKNATEAKAAANKIATEASAPAKQAAEALAKAVKAADEAAAQVKAAAAKLAAAKAESAKTPEKEDLRSAVAAAEKVAGEAATKANALAEAKVAAQKVVTEAEAKAKPFVVAAAAADKAAADATAKSKEADAKKLDANNRVRALPIQDVTATFYSTPITIKITPAATQPAKGK
jgi:hypothetical protein